MAIVWVARLQMGQVENEAGRQKLYENLHKANELDPNFIDYNFINAVISTWTEWNWDEGERQFLKALAVNPNHVLSRMYYAHLLMTLQRMDEALVQAKLALELDPKNPMILSLYSIILKGAGQHDSVLEFLEKALIIDPGHAFTWGQLGRAYYNLGEYDKDLELHKNYIIRVLGKETIPDLEAIYKEQGRQAAYEEVARLVELHSEEVYYRPISLARVYYRIGAHEKALDELEKAYSMHDPNMPYIGTGTRYEALHDSSRFLSILDRMNLPYPKKKQNLIK